VDLEDLGHQLDLEDQERKMLRLEPLAVPELLENLEHLGFQWLQWPL
jgi:hypothetical protein